MFALVPGIGVRWPAVIVSVSGLAFVTAALLSLLRVRHSQPEGLRDALFLAGLAVTLAIQLLSGIRLLLHLRETGPVQTIAVIVIVCLLIGIARSWELIGGPSIGMRSELFDIARTDWKERSDKPSDTPL